MERRGPWILGNELGRGAMGVVYEAVHEHSGAAAAVKTLLGSARGQGLERELAALRDLEHPGVVRFLDQGDAEAGPWYAMELLRGVALDHRVKADDTDQTLLDPTTPIRLAHSSESGAWTSESPAASATTVSIGGRWSARMSRQLGWLAQLCHALTYIHGKGVVHCDLKPANLVVTDEGRAVLVDFGVASKRRWRVGADAMRDANHRAGTLRYLAPERVLADPFDGRADLYALGCLLYHALTGRHAFPHSETLALLRAQVSEEPPRVELVNPSVPRSLCDAVHALLRKDPAARPGSALVPLSALGEVGVDTAPWPGSPEPSHHLFQPAVVGRESTLERLVGDVTSLDDGGGVRLISGPPGVGKSRVAMAVVESLAAQSGRRRVFTGAATPGAPLSVFSELGVGSIDAPSASAEELRQRWALLVEHRLAETAGDDPMVLVLDDVHDADELSRAAIERVCAVASARRWLVLLLSRSADPFPGLQAPRMPLGPLSAAGMADFVAQTLGHADHGAMATVTAWITARSEGNPLQAWAWLHMALDERWLVRDSHGYWSFRAPVAVLDEAPLPGEVEALVAQRLALLPESTQRFLRVVAVAGDPDDVGLIGAVQGGGWPQDRIQLGLARLMGAGLLVESAAGTLRFSSPAIRVVARGGAETTLHERAATALRSRHGTHPARLAAHYDATGDAERGRDAHAEAARRAVADGAVVLARRHLRAAIALHPEGSLGQAALRVTLADEVLLPMGAEREARDLMDVALGTAGATVVAAAAHRVRARARHRCGDAVGAVADAERAVAIATENGSARLGADTRRVLADILSELGRADEARAAHAAALELARSHGSEADRVAVLREKASFHRMLGELDEGLACLEEAEAAAARSGDRWAILDVAAGRGSFLVVTGDLAAAEPLLQRVATEMRELGMTSRALAAMNALGVVHSRNRNLPAAEAVLNDAIGLSDSVPRIAQLKHNLAMARLRVGRARGAATLLEEVLAAREASGSARGLAVTHSGLGQARLALGEYDTALTHFRVATAQIVEMNAHRSSAAMDAALGRVHALCCLGRMDAARAALAAIPRSEDAAFAVRLGLATADVSLRLGDAEEARKQLPTEAPTPDLQAWLLMCRGIVAVHCGELPQGLADLKGAQSSFESMGHGHGVAACLHRRLRFARGATADELRCTLAAVTADLELQLTETGLPTLV